MKFGASYFNEKLLKNFLHAFILQGANYILPLLTIPYLVRVLGPEKYGLIFFAQAITQYFVLITDYGFMLSAPKKIAINRENGTNILHIFNSVFLIKSILTVIGFFVLAAIVFSITKLTHDSLVYISSYLLVIGNLLFPIWFFQGMEQMKYISMLNISAKTIYVVSIFIFVKVQSDYILVPVLGGMSVILVGLLSLWVIRKEFNIKIMIPPMNCIYAELKDGWHMFTSMLSVSVYSTSNVIILGFISSNTVVAYFRVVEILTRNLSTALMQPITQVLYPYLSKLMIQSKIMALSFSTRVIVVIAALNFIAGIFLITFADTIIYFLFGHQYESSIIVLRILSFLPFILGVCGTVGPLILLPLNLHIILSKALFVACIFNIAISIPLSYRFQHVGAAFAVLATEFVASAMLLFILHRKQLINIQ